MLGVLPLLIVTALTRKLTGAPTAYLAGSLALYAAGASLVLSALPAALPGPGLGAPNRVTLGRATLILPVAALAAHPGGIGPVGAWWIVGLSTAALVLDGVDGWVARRTGSASSFGGRFDMELDAFFILGLSGLAWSSGAVGPWVLLIGAMRYLFVTAGRLWPALRAPLPFSQRRRVVCVVQVIALLACLLPPLPTGAAPVLAAGALTALSWSFAVDLAWLLGPGRAGGGDPGPDQSPPIRLST